MKSIDWGMRVPTTPKGQKPETIYSIKSRKTPTSPKQTVCEYCKGTGQHLSPDVSEPILMKCSNKKCNKL